MNNEEFEEIETINFENEIIRKAGIHFKALERLFTTAFLAKQNQCRRQASIEDLSLYGQYKRCYLDLYAMRFQFEMAVKDDIPETLEEILSEKEILVI